MSLTNWNGSTLDADLTPEQWRNFYEEGLVKIGKTLSDEELVKLQERIADIMSGKIQYGDRLLMQLDPGGDYGKHVESKQTTGFKGATVNYRKIGEAGCGLECDDVFLSFMQKPIFHNICKRVYGAHASIATYRSMLFNKPARGGTDLPWHQDGGEWWALDRDPLCFVWTAIDPAKSHNGCVQAIRGSHKLGIVSRRGHTLSKEHIEKYCVPENIVNMECEPGESWLVHNWVIHRSGVNESEVPRKAFSVNYIDGRTMVLDPKPPVSGDLGRPGQTFPIVWKSPFQVEVTTTA